MGEGVVVQCHTSSRHRVLIQLAYGMTPNFALVRLEHVLVSMLMGWIRKQKDNSFSVGETSLWIWVILYFLWSYLYLRLQRLQETSQIQKWTLTNWDSAQRSVCPKKGISVNQGPVLHGFKCNVRKVKLQVIFPECMNAYIWKKLPGV